MTLSSFKEFQKINERNIVKRKHYRSGKTMFLSFTWKYWYLLLIALSLLFVTALTQALPSIIIGEALDILANQGFNDIFTQKIILLLVLAILFVIISFISAYTLMIIAFKYQRDLRQEFFDIVQDHSMTFHDENNSSKLLSMGMNEISQIRMSIMPAGRMLLQTLITLLVVGSILYNMNKIIFYWFFFSMIIFLLLGLNYVQKIGPIREKLSNELGFLTENSQEIFRGIEVVRGLSTEAREQENFNLNSTKYAKLQEKEGKLSSFFYPALVIIFITSFSLLYGLYQVSTGEITSGELVTIIGLLFTIQMVNFALPASLLMIRAGLINSDRIWKIMNWVDPMPDNAFNDPNLQVNWSDDLHFNNLTLSYDGKIALQDINITIPVGSQVVLIGGPGSGKSSFLKLLLRLYDPNKGEIRIGNQLYSEIPAKIVREHVTLVEQEIFLFNGTVRENVSFSKPEATDEEIIEALKLAQAYEFVEKLEKGIYTEISERATSLSGGQRQRLAIARALLANPNILLLDDSVSAVDSKTEKMLRKALDNLLRGRTSISVTQRLVSLVKADLVILLDEGKIIASGTHLELLSRTPEYQQIFELLPDNNRITGSN
jgi:ABC-type multidrug transport system fused ATPase/permease subunit